MDVKVRGLQVEEYLGNILVVAGSCVKVRIGVVEHSQKKELFIDVRYWYRDKEGDNVYLKGGNLVYLRIADNTIEREFWLIEDNRVDVYYEDREDNFHATVSFEIYKTRSKGHVYIEKKYIGPNRYLLITIECDYKVEGSIEILVNQFLES
jgi:hypothetical protein